MTETSQIVGHLCAVPPLIEGLAVAWDKQKQVAEVSVY